MSSFKMNQQILSFAFVVVCVQFTCQYTTANDLTPKVLLTNDGPTILGATTTFRAKLIFVNETVQALPTNKTVNGEPKKFLYVYKWIQWTCGRRLPETVTIEQNTTCNFTSTYTCPEDIGEHTVTVEVRKNWFIIKPLLVSNATTIEITEHINAKLNVMQGVSCNSSYGLETCNVVATNKSVDMVVNIHDPSNFFKGATLLYHWRFGDGVADATINQPTVSHMYKKPGHYGISVNMTAIFPDDFGLKARPPKTGNVKHNLNTMDAVKNLIIKGKGSLEVGEKAKYNISCLASLPVEFCWYIVNTTAHAVLTDYPNTTMCNKIILTNKTWVEIHPLFNASGGYSLRVHAQNAVSNANSNKKVHVDSSTNTVIGLVIGILFGIAGCVVCVGVITAHMRRSNRPHVEVANFDFQRRSRHRMTLGKRLRLFFSGGTRSENLPLTQNISTNQSV